MSVYQNINGTLARMDASDLVQLAAVDTEGILGGTPGATTNGQTLVDQLAADDVQAQTDIGQIKTDLSDYHVTPSRNHMRFDNPRAVSSGLAVTVTETSIRVVNATAGTYRNAAYFMPVTANTDYVIKTHAVVTSGVACFNVFTADAQTQIASTSRYSADADIELSFNSGAQTMIIISFFSAFDTSVSGDVLYQNPLLYTAADYAADPSYVPYYVNYKDFSTVKDGTITYTSGITQQFATDVPLHKQGNLCCFSITLTGIVSTQGQWFNIGTLPTGFIPSIGYRVMNAIKNASADVIECQFETSGNIRLRDNSSAIASTDYIHFNGAYYTP